MLRLLPKQTHPDLLVGFETSDDAGIFRLSQDQALVQTMDFFTPIVDDPYAYGQIAAANALSDVYAMGGRPITAMNIACFNPASAPAEVWSRVLQGMYDKVAESGAVIVGGHSVIDTEPKFGLSVTGMVDPRRMFANTGALPGDAIWLSKPLGTGIVATAAKSDACTEDELALAINAMSRLNADASERGLELGVRCATDITGFGLLGHLSHVARASSVSIELDAASISVLPGVERMIEAGMTTGGAVRNREFVAPILEVDERVPSWLMEVVSDPQTSGGLALFTAQVPAGMTRIGRVLEGPAGIRIV